MEARIQSWGRGWAATVCLSTFLFLVAACTRQTFKVSEITNGADPMRSPYGVAVNSRGQLYVADSGNSRILVFDSAGQLLTKWDASGSKVGQFLSLGFGGVAIDRDDNVFVVDNGNHRVQKFDPDGRFLLEWGKEGVNEGEFIRAIGIATDRDGNVFVTDDANPYVQKFTNNGRFLSRFGGPGTGPGTLSHATGIAIGPEGLVLVSDFETKLVQVFSGSGEYLRSWSLGEDSGIDGVPEAILVDQYGRVYVSDYALGRVRTFDLEGRPGATIGDSPLAHPMFPNPTGLALDSQNRLFVACQAANNVVVVLLP